MSRLGLFQMPSELRSTLHRPRESAVPLFGYRPDWTFLALAVLACCLALLASVAYAQKPEDLKSSGYVNDFAGVLSPGAKAQITALCAEVEQKTQAQIAVVTVKSLNGQPIEEYSIALAQHWGVGPKQSARGVMILLAIDDHKDRFEVGYGLEPILPDGKTGGFGREAVPLLRQANYGAALYLMTRRVADVIAEDRHVTLTTGTPIPVRRPRRQQDGGLAGVIVVLAVLFFFVLLFSRGGPRSGYTRRGGGWWIGPMIGGGMGGWGGGGWGGGGGFGGGGSGGGFGGFGGGSFGGGGSTGSW